MKAMIIILGSLVRKVVNIVGITILRGESLLLGVTGVRRCIWYLFFLCNLGKLLEVQGKALVGGTLVHAGKDSNGT